MAVGADPAANGRRRQPFQRRADPQVIRSFRCPKCGGPHSRVECGVTDLDVRELRRLRLLALEELHNAVRSRADREHVDNVLQLLAGIDSRIARELDRLTPSVRRRQVIAAQSG